MADNGATTQTGTQFGERAEAVAQAAELAAADCDPDRLEDAALELLSQARRWQQEQRRS